MSEIAQDNDRQQRLGQAIAEYLEAVDVGQPVDSDMWLERHPDLKADLAEFLADHAELDLLVARERPPSKEHGDSAPADVEATTHFDRLAANDTREVSEGRSKPILRGTAVRLAHHFGDYEVIEEIARGGMGVVYKARQRSLDRTVALKTIRAGELADREKILRFRAEAANVARLDHPHIVPIYDVGEEHGVCFFSMGYVEGDSLRERVRENLLPPREAARILQKVAGAIGHAHEKGIVHRDVKPANILIDAKGEPRVTDFGLAKLLAVDSELTATGQILGTPNYMSPEQATGQVDRIGPLSDVYSLGATLCCLLTGRPPFQAATTVETIQQVVESEPVAPRALNASIPRDLETICLKCLRKDPQRRYESVAALAADLGRWLNAEPIVARPVSRVEKLWLWCKRQPAIAASVGALTVTIVIVAGVVAAQLRENQLAEVQNDHTRAESLVEAVLTAPAEAIPFVMQNLGSFGEHCRPILRERLEDQMADPTHRLHSAVALAELGEVDHEFLVEVIPEAVDGEAANIIAALSREPSSALDMLRSNASAAEEANDWRHQARLAITTLQLGDVSLVRDMCQLRPDPIQRSWFIETFQDWHGNVAGLAELVADTEDAPFRSGICLAVGSIPVQELSSEERQAWQPIWEDWYKNKSDPGTHSAADWVLRHWQLPIPELAATPQPTENVDWHINSVGMTMLRIPHGSFIRVCPWIKDDVGQKATLSQPYLLGDREVTRAQFQQFIDDPGYPTVEKPREWEGANASYSPTETHPVNQVTWYDALLFCNWLSEKEGLTPCYERSGETETTISGGIENTYDAWRLISDANGYRLPTEAEWEYACRARSATHFGFGDDEALLGRYAVVKTRPLGIAGSKLPNGWGLFDIHGNVSEWCQDWWHPDLEFKYKAELKYKLRPQRGGNCGDPSQWLWSIYSMLCSPGNSGVAGGFRVARSYP